MAGKLKEPIDEKLEQEQRQLVANRQREFKKLLGDDCDFIDALVINLDIHPEDVKKMLNRGCSKQLIKEILL